MNKGKLKALTNVEIERMLRDEKDFQGVLPLDLIGGTIKDNDSFILNFDSSTLPGLVQKTPF